jgi:hypothetical protein
MDNKTLEDGLDDLGWLAIVLIITAIAFITWIILEI